MLSLLRSLQPNLPTLLWHGYTGSWETAGEAVKLGVILGYGRRLFQSKLAHEGARLITLLCLGNRFPDGGLFPDSLDTG